MTHKKGGNYAGRGKVKICRGIRRNLETDWKYCPYLLDKELESCTGFSPRLWNCMHYEICTGRENKDTKVSQEITQICNEDAARTDIIVRSLIVESIRQFVWLNLYVTYIFLIWQRFLNWIKFLIYLLSMIFSLLLCIHTTFIYMYSPFKN